MRILIITILIIGLGLVHTATSVKELELDAYLGDWYKFKDL